MTSIIRTLTCSTAIVACLALPATAQTGDTRAHVDLAQSHTVVYPNGFENSGEQGTVTLAVGVGEDGLVSHVRVAQSSGYKDLDSAAEESALNWRYIPAMHDGNIHPDDIMLKVVYERPPAASAPAH